MSVFRMNTFWSLFALPTLVPFYKDCRDDRVFNLTVWQILLAVVLARQSSSRAVHWHAQNAGDPKTQRDTALPAQTLLSLTPRSLEVQLRCL
jgi:hypothetical protein